MLIEPEKRKNMLEICDNISVRKQATLLQIPRTKIYYKPIINEESTMANLITEIYLSSDCRYGYRKITAALRNKNMFVNAKKVLRIMRELGIEGLYPKRYKNTSTKNKSNKVYEYLLSGIEINRSNQVWATDITYIKIQNKFMYFMAIIDLHSRYIVAHGLSHSMELEFCIDILDKALLTGCPEIFNTDQGSQYTSNKFTHRLKEKGIKISMDHKGRCFDNIFVERLWRTLKQEVIYYYRPENISSLENKIEEFVPWYNKERLHQSLQYQTAFSVYFQL